MILEIAFLIAHIYSAVCNTAKPFCESCDGDNCEACRMSDLQGSFHIDDGKCVSCKPLCANCTNDGTCIDCFYGYGKDENGDCVPCNVSNCYDCNESTVCIDCTKESKLSADRDKTSPTYGQCIPPPPNCSIAMTYDSSKCITCEYGYFEKTEWMPDGTMINYGCQKCEKYELQNCKKINGCDCLECSSGYVLSQGNCIPSSEGPPNCLELNSDKSCSECNIGFCLNNTDDTCYQSNLEHCAMCEDDYCYYCEDEYQKDTNTGLCVDCHTANHCIECRNDKTQLFCQKCEPGYILDTFDGECTTGNCQIGQYEDENNKCLNCTIKDCIDCSKSGDICERCMGDLLVDMDGSSPTYGQCVECRVGNCALCLGSPSVCSKCKEGYEYINWSYCKYEPTPIPAPTETSTEASTEFSIEASTDAQGEDQSLSNIEIDFSTSQNLIIDEGSSNKSDDNGGGLSAGEIAGIAVGSVAGAGIIAGVSTLTYLKVIKKRKVSNIHPNDEGINNNIDNEKDGNKDEDKSDNSHSFSHSSDDEEEEEEEEEAKDNSDVKKA